MKKKLIFISFILILSRVAAWALTPQTPSPFAGENLNLESVIPKNFGPWRFDPNVKTVLPNEEGSLASKLYNQTVARGYRHMNSQQLVMLVIAYGRQQSDTLQLHRPEVCYVANGFEVLSNRNQNISIPYFGETSIPARRLNMKRDFRYEPVTYWTRVGNAIPVSNLERQFEKLIYGLSGRIPDGILVRVSNISQNQAIAFDLHDQFINDLLSALDLDTLGLITGPLISDKKSKKNSTEKGATS